MDKENEETVLKAVEYTNSKTEFENNRIHLLLSIALISLAVSLVIRNTSLVENAVFSNVSDFFLGGACGLIIWGTIATSRLGMKLKAFKQRVLKRNADGEV